MVKPGFTIPAYSGWYFTDTIHHKPAPNVDPSKTKLPQPCAVCITGGGRGIGQAMAVAYAQAGASDIILTSRTSQELESAAEKVKAVSKNVRVSTVSCDVTVEADVESLVRSIKEKHGRLDVLVNNAGYLDAGWQPITEGPADDWKRVLEVNVFGVYLVTRQLLPLLLSSQDGLKTVMGVTSMSSHFAQPSIAMGMSKLSLNRFMEYFADTYREEGLLAYSLHPGGVQTKMSTNPDKVPAGTQESE